jgi:Carboxypeptidase regulatory-like domain
MKIESNTMRRIFEVGTLIAATAAYFVAPSLVIAQTSNGTVVGTVVDPIGAAIVGATITLKSVETDSVRTTATIQNGSYRIDSVLPGTYTETISAPGFTATVLKGLSVPGSVITTSDASLKLGSENEKVEVSAENTSLNTDNAQISGTIGTNEISNLPLNSLSAYSLALTLPGVTTAEQGGFSNGVNFAVGGGRPRANNFLIEGQDNNDAGIQGQGLQPENIEAQKEVIIIQNDYTSEYGHGAGSVSNLIFKSGTNQFHGSVYERHLNSSLDATDHYDVRNEIPKTLYRENLFGFTAGGPIVKNKIFAFGSYQWDYYRSTANLSPLTVPSANGYAKLQSLPSNPRIDTLIQAYAGLQGDPALLASLGGQTSIALGPDPTTSVDRGSVEIGDVVRRLGADTNSPELDLKGDYLIGKNDTLSLRYIHTSYLAPFDTFNFSGQLPGFDTNQQGAAHNAGIVETHIFSPNVVNEFRLSYGRIGFAFGLPSSTISNPLFGTPGVSISSLTGWGIPTNIPQGRFHNTYQFQDSVSITHGKHFYKVGTDIADIRVVDQIPFNFYGTISYTTVPGGYTGLANYIDDFGGTGSISQNFGSPNVHPRIVSQNYFAEDTWKVMQNLSLDYGFRYEYNGAPFNAPGTPYPAIDYSDPACFPSSTTTCNLKQDADGSEWGPRVGFAYSPTFWANHQSVVRAGFGTFYDVLFTNIIDNIQATAPNAASPLINSLTSGSNPRGYGNWSSDFSSLNHTPLPTNTSEPISKHLLAPRTFHWNLNVQQELWGGFTGQVSYVGERGEHLFGTTEFNPYVNDWFSGNRLINSRGRIVVRDNSGDSNYNGLWAQLDKKMTNSLLFRASYTYAKAMDDVSEIFTTNNESTYGSESYPTPRRDVDMGLSAYDHRQRLVLAYIWAPPVWHTERGMKVLGNVVNHWSIAGITSFQSGTPMNVETGFDTNGDGISNDRPLLSNPKAPIDTYAFDDSWYYFDGNSYGTYCSGASFWYTNLPCEEVSPSDVHWIVPALGASRPISTIGRNSLISPGYQNWDMNIQRSFKVGERVSLDLRGELFNVFNHGNASSAYIGDSTLTSDIVSDSFSNNGANTFYDFGPTVGGYRHAKVYIKFSF